MADLNTARYQWTLDAIGPMGHRTWAIAKKLHITTSTARRRLRVLEAAGLVQRHPRYTYDNDIYWMRKD